SLFLLLHVVGRMGCGCGAHGVCWGNLLFVYVPVGGRMGGSQKVDVAGEVMEVEERDPILSGKGLIHMSLDGKDTSVCIRQELPRGFSMLYHGSIKDEVLVQRADLAPLQKFMPKKKTDDVAHLIRTPMPGSVVKISVRYKQKVNNDPPLLYHPMSHL
ncbi:unnamed protein product, partial [Closterium sp. NIES-54]